MRKLTTTLLSSALLISPITSISQAEASTQNTPIEVNETNTLNTLVPTIPTDSELIIVPYGAEKPDKNASTHDISISAYNYQVAKVGAQVYTDKFIKGKTSMKVTVNNWTITKYHGVAKNDLTITLYNSSGKKISSKTLSMTEDRSNSASFTGLSTSTKYYVEFSVELNEQTYSFDGSIS